MSRPTVTLALIAKNEANNLPRLIKSVEGCFDEIILVDTGSTDETKRIAFSYGCKVFDFKWIDDFSAARNFAFSKASCDFIAWLDLDDVLDNKESFIQWRDYAMEFADYWLAPYHYTLDDQGNPICSFARERVIRRSLNPQWNYFVHEGVKAEPGWRIDTINTWSVKHLRTAQDQTADRGRNLRLLEGQRGQVNLTPNLDARMQWYLGKEYYDNQKYDQALTILIDVITKQDLEIHDRILALQFASYSALALAHQLKPEFQDQKIMIAQQLAQQGLALDPKRAEFYCLLGETYTMRGDLLSALPYFSAAENCITPEKMGMQSMSPIFTFAHCYQDLPKIQKAQIYVNIGQINEAEREIVECVKKYPTDQARAALAEVLKMKPVVSLDGPKTKTDDIVFTCPPHQAYPFDEEIYKTQPLGGSETALVQMAKLLKEKTGRRVIVFNMRESDLVASSGVEYMSHRKLNEYMSKTEPGVHIAWRHNIKCSTAKTYLWCHDLSCATVESQHNFDHFLCLSDFHKNYVMAKQGVPREKIIVTRNGIPTQNFKHKGKVKKNPNKLVWLSSPDRGLINCIPVLDLVREKFPEIELHCFYGFTNLYKYGLGSMADHIKELMRTRPWIIDHGFVEQKEMHHECADAVVWPHTANFIETFAISAIEALANGIYPVTRRLGALQNTLKAAEDQNMATLLDHDAITPQERRAYANAIIKALEEKAWERVKIDLDSYSWESVADEWIDLMKLNTGTKAVLAPENHVVQM